MRDPRRTGPALFLCLLLFLATAVCRAAEKPAPGASLPECVAALSRDPGDLPPRRLTSPLRLVSWNAMKFRLDGSRRLAQQLGVDADLMLLQESVRGAPVIATAYRYFSPGFEGFGTSSGVEILSRVTAQTHCSLQFREPWLRSPKAVAVLRVPSDVGWLLVVNLHAINFSLGSEDYAGQLETVGELLAAHGGPALVAGDFNHWNGKRNAALYDFAADHGLSEGVFEPDWRSRHFGRPVDSVFQRGLRFLAVSAIPTDRSDHHPVAALIAAPLTAPAAGIGPAAASQATAP